jgi:hypothetical protein
VLTDGLIVCQKRVYAEKCKKEPTRCLKCHGWNHLSYDCPQDFDTCGTCGGRHKTSTCSQVGVYCVSCRSNSHASWARTCPTFLSKCAEMDAKLLENQMPYFPTEETWTHVSQPPKPPPLATMPAAQPHASQHAGGWETVQHRKGKYRQATLPYGRRTPHPQEEHLQRPVPPCPGPSPATPPNNICLGPPARRGDTDGDEGPPPPDHPR